MRQDLNRRSQVADGGGAPSSAGLRREPGEASRFRAGNDPIARQMKVTEPCPDELMSESARKAAGGRVVADQFRRARRHSRRIRVLKFVLPVSAVLLAAGFAGYSFLMSEGGVSVNLFKSSFSNGKLIMADPKLNGFTRDNLPYSMTAKRAIQAIDNTDVIQLQGISGTFPVQAGNMATVHAENGVYDQGKNTLDINSPMTLTTTDGMEAHFKSAFVNIAKNDLETSDPVDIKLKQAHITANAMRVRDGGKMLDFSDNVHVTVMPGALRTQAEPAETTNGAADAKN